MPGDEPTDWNDLQQEEGIEEVQRQLQKAVGSAAQPEQGDAPPPPPSNVVEFSPGPYNPRDEAWFDLLDWTRQGDMRNHAGNLEIILANDRRWQHVLGYCEFRYKILFREDPPVEYSKAGELATGDVARLRNWFYHEYGMSPPSRQELTDALLVASQAHSFHAVREYLEAIEWDGKPRCDKWLKAAFDAEGETEYLAGIGRKFLIGAVARVMDPGCKMDTMLILEGNQGHGKSTSVRNLFGVEWFSDATLPLGDKDAYLLIQGVWGYEMAELDSLNRAESTTAKAFASQQCDKFRPPYGGAVEEFKRQVVFVGTTNQDEYLKDFSGNRRYWPVRCMRADPEWIKVNRDQLWAEALHHYKAGDAWWITDDEPELLRLAEQQQDDRLLDDTWEQRLEEYLAKATGMYFTAEQLITDGLKIDIGSQQKHHTMRLAPLMKRLGWHKARRTIPIEGTGKKRQAYVYIRPEDQSVPPLPDGDSQGDLLS